MSLNEEERKIIVDLEFEKAKNMLSQTIELQKLGFWDMVANRLYYAVFHAACALLINDCLMYLPTEELLLYWENIIL